MDMSRRESVRSGMGLAWSRVADCLMKSASLFASILATNQGACGEETQRDHGRKNVREFTYGRMTSGIDDSQAVVQGPMPELGSDPRAHDVFPMPGRPPPQSWICVELDACLIRAFY